MALRVGRRRMVAGRTESGAFVALIVGIFGRSLFAVFDFDGDTYNNSQNKYDSNPKSDLMEIGPVR
jgi:hypothetical protein